MNNVEIVYTGINKNKDSKYKQFTYNVKVNGHWFNYSTGIGWIGNKKDKDANPDQYKPLSYSDRAELRDQFNSRHYVNDEYNTRTVYRKVPTVIDILYSLKVDADAGSMSFIDFCDNFGYDSDSIKATDIYRACMDTAVKLRGYKFPDGLEDY